MKFTFPPETRVLDGYTIKRAIHRGGFGEVYYALSDAGREVALKLLQNNSDVELRGVQQCLNLSHPNLVTIFDVRKDADGDHWILMEYIGGETLDAAIRRHPQGMPMELVRKWLPGISAGVAYLHSRGLVHRDLKPANVFSDAGAVKVGDVGLSKFITPSRRSAHTQSVGTVYYMAPEVAKGRYGKEVDIYALGIILFEMLTGHVPFDGESTAEILMKHLSEPPDLRQLPPRIQPVIARALQKDPTRRFESIEAFAKAFDDAVLGKGPAIAQVASLPLDDALTMTLPVRDANERSAALKPPLNGEPRPSTEPDWTALRPTFRGWLWILGAGLLFAVGTRTSGTESLAYFFMGMVFGFITYASPRIFARREWPFDERSQPSSDLERTQPGLDAGRFNDSELHVKRWQPALRVGVIFAFILLGSVALKSWREGESVAIRTSLGVAVVLAGIAFGPLRKARYTGATARLGVPAAFQPLAMSPFAWRTRMAHWVTSAALSAGIGGGMLAGMAAIAPSLFQLPSTPGIAPESLAFFGATTLIGAWLVTLAIKATEGATARHPEGRRDGLRRIALVAAGLCTGAAAWGLGDFLQLDLSQVFAGQSMDGAFEALGERPLVGAVNGRSAPTLLGFMVFFGSLFGLRSWWRQIDLSRESRFRAASVLMTVLVAWLTSAIFAFPQTWAMLWAAVISATVQLASPWSQPVGRLRPNEHELGRQPPGKRG